MNNLYRYLRYAVVLVAMMPLMVMGQITPTTDTNGNGTIEDNEKNLYLIQTNQFESFYISPKDNSNLNTVNLPNATMLWYFLETENDNGTQYYYIVNNSTGNYICNTNYADKGRTIGLLTFDENSTDKFKFKLVENNPSGATGYYNIDIKPNGSDWLGLNKQGGNASHDNGIRLTNNQFINQINSRWKFIPYDGTLVWPNPPFTVSTDSEKHYYKIRNKKTNTFCISTDPSTSKVIYSSTASNEMAWYLKEASSDGFMKYYYIINPAVDDKYMYYCGTATNGSDQDDAVSIKDINDANAVADRFLFVIVQAAIVGTNDNPIDGYYMIVPKLLIGNLWSSNSLGNNPPSESINMGIITGRGNDIYSHWSFEPTVYVAVEAPTITNNYDGTITLSTPTPNAEIYYTLDNTEPSNSSEHYTSSFSIGDAKVIKAIAYLGSDYSGVTTYNVPKYSKPTISFDSNTSEITITSEGTIYYNTGDGSQDDPTPAPGNLYSAPFTISSPTTVKAIATHAGYLTSDVETWSNAQHDYSRDYLTFDILSTGTLKWKSNGSGATKTISYSINNGSWTNITSSSSATINVSEGDVVRFKGSNTRYCEENKSNYSGFADGTATFNISGNIMSMTAGDNFANVTTLPGTWTFTQFFKQSKCLSAENLILPATTMTENCYRAMFSKCPYLQVAPALPATTLASYCYYYMFEECPITSAPELSAPTLVSNCYGYMFTGCTNLNYIRCFATTKSASGCLTNWVNNVSPQGTFVKDNGTSWSYNASGIPSGWDVNLLAVPVISCDGEFITITCQVSSASIYYRFGQTGSYSLYSTPIQITENTVVEAYAEKNELQSEIGSENCIAIKSYRFAGMEITPGPLYYGSNGYEIKDGWNYDSYNSIYGKTDGSTYFNFIELGQLFESSVFSASDGDIEKVLDPLDGWRVPTNAEWASILGTTRSGSTVNGSSNKHYAMIQMANVSGLLIFPDGETITGVSLSNMDNTTSNTGITEEELNNYLSQGCIFLPGSGYYDGQTWRNEHYYYWSSIENNLSTGYDLYFEPSYPISSVDSKNKESYYFPVYLVKSAVDEATRLLRMWTYNNNVVELPYSINAINGHSGNYAKGTFNFTTDVKVKESQPTYLWFQHADQSAAVYVDNTLVDKHWGGYNAFFVDITDHVHIGTNNIKVAVKNNEGSNLAPCAGDFNFNATLGEVKLISSPVVPNPDYGYDGFHITSTVTAASATITVKTTVPTSATVTCSINGENCNYSVTLTSTGEELTFTTDITDPHLWNGISDPYLYDVTLTIAKDGVVYHQFKRGYGLRFFEYVVDQNTPENSRFMLNGSPYLLRGVCMHNDLEGKANALTAEDIDNDFKILKELGCNFVRLAHYPHPKEVYDHCDKMGIIVQTEVPWVNNASTTQPADYYNHLEDQYRDMVNQHYNHPCIMFWGLSNETTTENNIESKNTIKAKIENYKNIIKGLDPERWVGYVMAHGTDNPSGYYNDPDVDWFGCNIYVGWYIDQNSNNPTNRLNTRLNNTLTRIKKPMAFSEYGCGGTPSCHSDDFMATTTRGNKERHDIEYQMWLHEGHIAAIKNKPQLLFTSQWQLFDIAVSGRREGYTICLDGESTYEDNNLRYLNNKGLVERDHKTKKDPFYLYKAWWNQTDKFVHICGKDYEKLTNRVIKCYTNDGSTLSLFVNNEEIETSTVIDNIATFTARNFNPGDVIRVNGATTDDTFTFTDYSEDYVFTTNGNWNVAANWSPSVPAAARNVTINADCMIPAKYTAQTNNITIGENGSLTIADGGQLVSNSAVNATVKKNIEAYTVSLNEGESLTNGWYFIASPITNGYTPTGSMVENNYDLYRLNPATTGWENYKNTTGHPNFTTLNNGAGYLYANEQNVTLSFTGTIKPYTTESDAHIMDIASGYNLIGNPYTFAAYIDKPYYSLNENRNTIVPTEIKNEPINPCTGVIVDGGENGVTVGFYKESQSIQAVNNGNIQMTLAQTITTRGNSNVETLDKAIVSFNEGDQLGKLYFGTQNANIYIPQNGKEYAIVSAEAQGEMPVNFEAQENGIYTITVKVEDVEMSYLHLIDNMTGANVDLLQTPSYSFEAKTTDYVSRFKLVFSANMANDNLSDDFAFFSNGQLIIANEGEATLQVIDVTGRVVATENIHGTCSKTVNVKAGVYVLRLTNGNEVKTQKIVIK